jgi:NAD-dependent SIR2 family protein deacetylase
MDQQIKRAAEAVRDAGALLITAGAGIGVDSGLPDFRGNEGFWKAYPPIARLGISFVDMANPAWFQRDPALAWAFYGHRLNLYRRTVPHQGFHQLHQLGQGKPGGCFVFTSNVDGHFQKAGFNRELVEECHGSIHNLQCCTPCSGAIWDADGVEVAVDEEAFQARDPLPLCPDCGGLARPNILMFGDWHWNVERAQRQGRQLRCWLGDVRRAGHAIAVIEIGAGTAVPTVRYFSEEVAGAPTATLVRINPHEPRVPGDRHVSLPLGAAEAVGRIFELCVDG